MTVREMQDEILRLKKEKNDFYKKKKTNENFSLVFILKTLVFERKA